MSILGCPGTSIPSWKSNNAERPATRTERSAATILKTPFGFFFCVFAFSILRYSDTGVYRWSSRRRERIGDTGPPQS